VTTQSNVERQEISANWLPWILVPLFIYIGLGIRIAGLKFISLDIRFFLLDWYNQLATKGFAALRDSFSNYTPPYLYLLFLATKTAGFLPKVTAIKLISICFDVLNAFLVYKILKIRFPQGTMPVLGASAFLLLPTVILNSAYWGQSDAVYAFFVLACLFSLMKGRPFSAMIFLGIAFSIKAQAAFVAPLIFLLILKKKIPWLCLVIIPAVYVLMMIPAALTGRPLMDLVKIYMDQEETYSALSMHAPNWYLFLPRSLNNSATVLLGLMIAVTVVLAWTTVYRKKFIEFTPDVILLGAMMSAAFMPFFLPKMHERYFYLADVLSFLMAFYFPQGRGWLLTLGYQLTSGLAYSIFLMESLVRLRHPLIGNLLFSALFVNIALIGFIFSNQWKLTNAIAENRSVTVS
jgi:Gpi18-like mannosyltransferase